MSNPTPPIPPHPDDAPATGEVQAHAVTPETVAPEAVAPEAVPAESAPADAQPTEAYPPADAQPTEAYPPADAQPTAVYPPADAQPTEAYPPAVQPGYGQPANDPSAYGQPAYGAPAYGAPLAGAPTTPVADRPRTMGWISLGVALGGLALVGAAFIPLVWVSLILALIGGVLLLVALVLGIITLASKKQGGKGLGIGAIAVSVLGGLAWIAAITLSFVLIAVSVPSAAEPSPSASESVEGAPEDEGTEEGTEEPTGTYDEAAFLAQVRPEITAILQEIDPSITEEMLGQFYSDEMLVATGKGVLVAGEAARDAFVTTTVESSDGAFTEDQATRFYDALLTGAEQHLVE